MLPVRGKPGQSLLCCCHRTLAPGMVPGAVFSQVVL